MNRTPFGRPAAADAWEMLSGLLQAGRMMPTQLRAPDGSLPLTILSGFLGAGKTTLLNRLLSDPGGRRIAALVNDFGRINIDAALVRSRTDDMISLSNGCVCCTVAADLTRTLIRIADRPDPPDALVLEASGLADPRGIAQVALANPALRLDGVLTLVDAVGFADAQASDDVAPTLRLQLDAADLLVLTKTDEAGDAGAADVRAALRSMFADKPLVDSVQGELPADVVLGVNSARDPRTEPPAPWDHASRFRSISVHASRPLDRGRLQAFLAGVAPDLLRAKGIVRLADDPDRRHVYHQVGQRCRLTAGDPWDGERPASTLVLISTADRFDAKGLDAKRLEHDFAQCAITE